MEADLGFMFAFGGNFAPRGFASCEGQLLPISQNTALFAILGTTYGGNGQTTFALPDLRGRTLIGQGQGPGLAPYVEGQVGGQENATITVNQLPAHTHALKVNSAAGTTATPAGSFLAKGPGSGAGPNATFAKNFTTTAPDGQMAAAAIASTGGGQPMPILSPYLTAYWLIATEGIFPSRN
jgi:microcystin-dependent protein